MSITLLACCVAHSLCESVGVCCLAHVYHDHSFACICSNSMCLPPHRFIHITTAHRPQTVKSIFSRSDFTTKQQYMQWLETEKNTIHIKIIIIFIADIAATFFSFFHSFDWRLDDRRTERLYIWKSSREKEEKQLSR